MKKLSIRELITEIGPCEFARRVRVDQSYASKVGRGLRQPSVELLGRAKYVFGDDLDVEASVVPVDPRGNGKVVSHGPA